MSNRQALTGGGLDRVKSVAAALMLWAKHTYCLRPEVMTVVLNAGYSLNSKKNT